MPKLYVIAGCNGAGKTTPSYAVLPEMLECREFVNADEIAKGLSPFNPSKVSIEAGRLMRQRMDVLMSDGADFAIETTGCLPPSRPWSEWRGAWPKEDTTCLPKWSGDVTIAGCDI